LVDRGKTFGRRNYDSRVATEALVVSPSLEGLHDGRHAKHSTGVTACQMICLDSIMLVINQVVVGWLVR